MGNLQKGESFILVDNEYTVEHISDKYVRASCGGVDYFFDKEFLGRRDILCTYPPQKQFHEQTDGWLNALESFNKKTTGQVVTSGRKFDQGKPQYSLIPSKALLEVVKVLTFGAQKYDPENWRRVPDAKTRYFDAAQRHLWQWKDGEINDEGAGGSDCHHLAAAISNLMFILQLELEEKENNNV